MHRLKTYLELKKIKKTTARTLLRSYALDLLALFSLFKGDEKLLKTPRVQFLYIHHTFTDELENLKRLISYLKINHQFISYGEAINKITGGKIDKPYIALSSDDGLKNNLLFCSVLQEFDIKACFFINPGIIDEQEPEKIELFCKQKINMPLLEFLTWDDVKKIKEMGHEIGSHTMMHDNLKLKPAAFIQEDLLLSKKIIEQHCGTVNHFAFPYGRYFHYKPEVTNNVFNSGYVSIACAERGCHISRDTISNQQLLIRRDHIILEWPIRHIKYFLIQNIKKASVKGNLFTYA